MPVRLVQRRSTQPLGLSTAYAEPYRRIVASRAAKGGFVAIERDEQNR